MIDHGIKMENLLLILTIQRSGSTLIFDLLRYHPLFSVAKTWELYQLTGVGNNRRRYPQDLSQTSGPHDHFIEVTPNNWCYMEQLLTEYDNKEELDNKIYLEKIHPHFINFSYKKIQTLAQKTNLRLLIVTRKPSDSIDSFWRYQERNENWYKSHFKARAVIHYWREFRFLKTILDSRVCPIMHITYNEIMAHPQNVVNNILNFCDVQMSTHNPYILSLTSHSRKDNLFQTGNNEVRNESTKGFFKKRIFSIFDSWYVNEFNKHESV